MLRAGLTGGVASGKSTVARLLAGHGAAVCDADAFVTALYGPGAAGSSAVHELFGDVVLTPEGAVDRAALAALVLPDGEARRRLEEAVHPLVRQSVVAWFAALESIDAARVGVFEAALLVETGMYRQFDRLIVVTAPVAVRRARALEAGWNPGRFDGILAAQLDDDARAAVADFVIDNAGDAAALEARVAALWGELLAAADGAAHPRREAGS